MVKVSKVDIKILDVARLYETFYCSQCADVLGKRPEQVHRRLTRLVRANLLKVTPIGTSPRIYSFNKEFNNDYQTSLELYKVCCPKCGHEHTIHSEQQTKTCENPDCMTKNNKSTRFHIYHKRIIGVERI